MAKNHAEEKSIRKLTKKAIERWTYASRIRIWDHKSLADDNMAIKIAERRAIYIKYWGIYKNERLNDKLILIFHFNYYSYFFPLFDVKIIVPKFEKKRYRRVVLKQHLNLSDHRSSL